jgi:peptidoglycan/LPS O-acetylase OafA/YrhL
MIALALVVVTTLHAAVGVGMDERLETLGPADLAGHWWALPVTLLLLGAAALVVLGAASFIRRARDAWRAVASIVACGAGALGASALTAAIRPGSAAPGAAVGLLLAVVVVRLLGRRSPSRADLNLVVGILLVLFLGWRAAANPLWPALLLVTAGLLLASASFPPGRGSSRRRQASR